MARFPRAGAEGVSILHHIVDPPPVVVGILIVGVLLLLRRGLRRDHFYVLIVTTVLCFLAAEAVVRFVDVGSSEVPQWWEPLAKGEKYFYEPNGKLVYRYPDNPRGYFDEENAVVGNINSLGFRGAEVERRKSPGTIRIAFLGDSFTVGIGVKDDDTLPERFERLVKRDCGDVEVLNLGISGSSTQKQIEFLESYGLSFEPDIVVVVLFLNDADLPGTVGYLSKPRVFVKVRRYSYFVNALFGALEKSILHRRMIREYREGYREGSRGWEEVKSALAAGQSLAEERDFQLVVAVYPVLFHLDRSYPFEDAHRAIASYCASMEIPYVDLLDGLRGQYDKDLWVHRTDQHPNEKAHALAAAELARHFIAPDCRFRNDREG
jgi:hypothetical protein